MGICWVSFLNPTYRAGVIGMMIGSSIFAADVFGDEHLSNPKPAK